jgi:hypothetical protein
MKKHFQLFGILLFAMALVFSSCKKDEDDNNNGNSTVDHLTSGAWKITAMMVDPGIDLGGGIVITDFFTMMPACSKDDLITFHSDGKIIFDEGATKCVPSDPQTTEGTWTLSGDNKTLTMKEPGEDDIVVTITEISSSMMKGTYTMDEDFGAGTQTYTITITMAH